MGRPLHPDWPVAEMRSVDDLMDVAVAMEAEAAHRYDQLAHRVKRRGQSELADLFARLARLERDHQHGLEAWARREHRRPPRPAPFGWQLPETFGDDADERPLDPYLALAVAVRNEERAFAFYSYLAAQCGERTELRLRAEALAREELAHVALLRGMRRRAFHARAHHAGPWADPSRQVRTADQLDALAHGLEAGSAELDLLLLTALAGHPAARLLAARGIDAAQVADAGAAPASATVEAARRAGHLAPGALAVGPLLRLARANAAEVLDIYLAIADRATGQDVLHRAQDLAHGAMARLALVNELCAGTGESD